ncbi:MAG TPA: sodium ion-translocating decarboxylase subunit beta [Bacillota bacterium]|nr:sodium ion-translocating decarboxylase subunit beta [Bacillota bacterium]HPE38551.1 sodium ion-translocating decarboxylase subunit beta [Bacillota bacterium]
MYVIGGVLIALAIKKEYEPALLLPIGFGAILVNLPLSIAGIATDVYGVADPLAEPGFLEVLRVAGIANELFPILIFIAIGAMIDFTPLFKNPYMIFFGAAAQFGIFVTFIITLVLLPYFDVHGTDAMKIAASVGIIGAADGPTTIYVGNYFKLPEAYIGAISVAAYSYMSLVPIIQPPVIKLLTTKKERMIRMDYHEEKVPKGVMIVFPILVTIIAGIIVPMSVPLVGSLMFGNLIRVSGVLERLSQTAQNELANLVTILLGITIGSTMVADKFIQPITLLIMLLGLFAFVFDTAGGVLFAKFLNLFMKKKMNPMIGASGISAFPMSARVVQKIAKEEDPTNFILMQAISANVSGQLGSIVAGGFIIALVSYFVGM